MNLWRLEQAIAAGKLDAKKAIDADALIAAGVIRRVKDGVKLLGKGELSPSSTSPSIRPPPRRARRSKTAGGTLDHRAKKRRRDPPAKAA